MHKKIIDYSRCKRLIMIHRDTYDIDEKNPKATFFSLTILLISLFTVYMVLCQTFYSLQNTNMIIELSRLMMKLNL